MIEIKPGETEMSVWKNVAARYLAETSETSRRNLIAAHIGSIVDRVFPEITGVAFAESTDTEKVNAGLDINLVLSTRSDPTQEQIARVTHLLKEVGYGSIHFTLIQTGETIRLDQTVYIRPNINH